MSLSPAVAHDRQPLRFAARFCAFAAAIVAFAVSAMALQALGVAYEAPGGGMLQKLHPATYLAGLALVLEAASRPRPLAYIAGLPQRFPGAALLVVNLALMVVYAALFQRTPIAPLIDTFVVGAIMLALYEDFSDRERAALRLILHVILSVNACLGLAEYAFHFRLTPFVAGGRPIVDDYRSTALLGHPLLNAGTTTLYAAMLILGADRAIRPPLRLAMTATQLIALVAFGGRTSLILALVVVFVAALKPFGEALGGRRFDLGGALAAALVAPLVVAAATAAWLGGALAPLLERFAADRGSAEARLVALDLFNAFSFEDILLGPNPERLATLQNTLGIEYGVENSWLGLVFQYGALMSIFLIAGFTALLAEFWRCAKSGAWALTGLFLLQVSSSATLSVKSFAFNQFAILMLAVFDRRAAVAPKTGGPP